MYLSKIQNILNVLNFDIFIKSFIKTFLTYKKFIKIDRYIVKFKILKILLNIYVIILPLRFYLIIVNGRSPSY